MKPWVVDASVVVKWFVPEIHTDAAVTLIEEADDLLAPDLMLAETGNILWKKIRLGEITQSEGREILHAITQCPIQIHPSEPLLETAYEIACAIDRTFYDSLYLSLAIVQKGVIVTADKKFFNVVQGSQFCDYIAWVEALRK